MSDYVAVDPQVAFRKALEHIGRLALNTTAL